ncbi:MAG TPA: DUF3152 domain-containing protein [Candidatus Saccharimonadales bacterium]
MRVIDHRQFRLSNQGRRIPRWLKISLTGLGVIAGIFVLLNLAMGILYRDKVLPNYTVASVPIGNISFDKLGQKVSADKLLPQSVTFKKDDAAKNVAPKDLGVAVDWTATQENIKKSRSWLPIVSLVVKKTAPLELKLDNSQFAAAAEELETTFTKAPLPERIAFRDNNFAIVPPEAGYQPEISQLRMSLISSLEQGKNTLAVPTKATNSSAPTGKLQSELSLLQKRLETKITLTNTGRSKQLSRTDIANFYEPSDQTLKLSDAKIGEVVARAASGFGITAVNQSEAISAIHYALSKQQAVNFALANQGVKVYHYCTAVKGVDASALTEYRQKLAAVYGDPRGWNNGGAAALVHAESGCDFTAWLSAPASMTSFGAICDSYYSCRVGPNVVVNYDRWTGATDPWNAAGGTLEDYRVMVINHETGHWFGFGHRSCPGAGQPAPVMQQQSIDLQGCTFNAWPTAAELADL